MRFVLLALSRPLTIVIALIAVALASILAVQRMPVDIFPRRSAIRPSMWLNRMAAWTLRRWKASSPITTSITSSTSPESITSKARAFRAPP